MPGAVIRPRQQRGAAGLSRCCNLCSIQRSCCCSARWALSQQGELSLTWDLISRARRVLGFQEARVPSAASVAAAPCLQGISPWCSLML